MNIQKIIAIILAIGVAITAFYGCSKKEETVDITKAVSRVEDADDNDNSVVTEKEKSNIIILEDENGNKLSLIPILDEKGTTIIAGYVLSGIDKNGKAIKDEKIIGTVVAISATATTGAPVYSILLKDKKTVFLDFYTDDNGNMIALQSASDGKYYKTKTTKSEGGYTYIQLVADEKGKPIEVEVKKEKDGTTKVVEKKSGKVVSNNATNKGKVTTPSSGNKKPDDTTTGNNPTPTPPNDDESKDKVTDVTFDDYKNLASINIVLSKNSTAQVGLASDSPLKVDVKTKAYVKSGVLYIQGNGDYYVTQSSDCSTWYGKIVVNLGNYGLARVRMAGVDIESNDSAAIEFIDTDTVIDDTDSDGEVIIKYTPTVETKTNPNAILTFVNGTTNSLKASGNSVKGSGTIYSQCKLSVKGNGTANVYSKNKNAIQTERSIGIQNATLNLDAAAGKGIRSKKLIDIEENATININSMGDAIRCAEFMMDTDVKKANGDKDKSTGSTVNLYPKSADASPTTGDGIDADDSVIIRCGNLNINVDCVKSKYGIKVRRVNNEDFIKIIKSENITDISDFKQNNTSSPYYADVVLNEKEYAALVSVANVSPASATYQGIRTDATYSDTFRITGGTTKINVKLGRNSKVLNSTNSQPSLSVYASRTRTISIDGEFSSGSDKIGALLYSSENLSKSKTYTVTYGLATTRDRGGTFDINFNNNVGYHEHITN